ncbi:beta-lactamase regulator AmpE [Citrobacter freundii]
MISQLVLSWKGRIRWPIPTRSTSNWQLDHRVEAFFRRIKHFSMMRTVGMTLIAMGVTFLLLRALHGLLFNVPLLVAWILIGLLCIGAGKARLHYHAYLNAAARDDAHAREAMASELTLIHGVPPDCDEREFLRELQNALLWNNFRFYLAPLFWLIVGGPWGPVTLVGYAFLRAWQSWLARYQTPHQRLQSGIDAILHVLDWIPVRLAGVVYALLGHGEKALPAWFASLADLHTSQYQVLTRLAQFSLAREPHTDKVETPKAAVSMAKKTSFVVVVIIALLTIYGALV